MDELVIEVDRLRRRYGGGGRRGFDAVRDVTFSVARGQVFALLGTNGAGKTSTLEVVEGLLPATSGRVAVLGRDPWRDRRHVRPRIGVLLQGGGLPGDLTAAETGRMWAGTLTAPRSFPDVLALVGLSDRAGVRVRQLSGGERRRLDLAMALLGRPEVLFLDEPTTGLDPESRARTWQLVRQLIGEGTTVVLTTHYLGEAEALADRLAILHRGRIVRAGSPAEVTAHQPARVSFTLPAGAGGVVPAVPGALSTDLTPEGRVHISTRDLQRSLTSLLAWANAGGLVLEELAARPASLEEAFLAVAESDEDATDGRAQRRAA